MWISQIVPQQNDDNSHIVSGATVHGIEEKPLGEHIGALGGIFEAVHDTRVRHHVPQAVGGEHDARPGSAALGTGVRVVWEGG